MGKQLSNVVNDYLSTKYKITPSETSTNPRLLCEALEKSLGYGAVIVETRIVNYLYKELSMDLNTQPRLRMGHPEDFETYILELCKISNNLPARDLFKPRVDSLA